MKRIALINCMYGRLDLCNKIFSYYNELKKELLDKLELILVVAGSEGIESREVAEQNGWNYVEALNDPLNEKFNAVLLKAKEYSPDAVIVIGSDDVIDKRIFEDIYLPTKENALGFTNCYVYGLNENKLFLWNGYGKDSERYGETCGVGRYFSKKVLDKMNWKLWDSEIPLNKSLDKCLNSNLQEKGIEIKSLQLGKYFIVDFKDNNNLTKITGFNDSKYLIQDEEILSKIRTFSDDKIQCCYVARAVEFFKEKICKRFNLSLKIDANKPLIVFGCYDGLDYHNVIEHAKKNLVVICWLGSDAMRHEQMKQLVGLKNIHHISSSEWTNKDLEAVGLNYTFIPLSISKYDDVYSEKLGKKIYIYTSRSNPTFYGKDIYDRLISHYGQDMFIVADAFTFGRKELIYAYKDSFIGLRLVGHDGLSETVCELGLMGRKVVYNGNTPNAVNYSSFEDIVNIIDEEMKNISYRNDFLALKMKEFLKHNDSFLNISSYDKKTDESRPLINILIRTHRRPEAFKKCIESISKQAYKNIKIYAGIESCDEQTAEYVKNYAVNIIRYDKIVHRSKYDKVHTDPAYGDWFPFNSYLDIMTKGLNKGYVMYLDDDDLLFKNDSLEIIANNIKSENDLLMWRVKYPADRLMPNESNWNLLKQSLPIRGADISGIGYLFHSKYKGAVNWGYWKKGDFRVATSLIKECDKVVFIDDILTGIQGLPNGGKTEAQINQLTQNNNQFKKQTLMKIIIVQENYKGRKIGNINQIMELDDTTAKALIQKRIAIEFTDDIREDMLIVEIDKQEQMAKIIEKAVNNTNKEKQEKLNLQANDDMNIVIRQEDAKELNESNDDMGNVEEKAEKRIYKTKEEKAKVNNKKDKKNK